MEIWKDIPGYEGIYQCSNIGRILKLPQERINWTGGVWITPAKIMSFHLNADGYACLSLTNAKGIRRAERVHRLVAITFIDNPNHYPEVNHLNGIRNDNRVENLEWCSHQENCAYTAVLGNKSPKRIKCVETNEIFNTSTDAANKNGGNSGNIRKAAKEGKRVVNGFHYVYIDKSLGELDDN